MAWECKFKLDEMESRKLSLMAECLGYSNSTELMLEVVQCLITAIPLEVDGEMKWYQTHYPNKEK